MKPVYEWKQVNDKIYKFTVVMAFEDFIPLWIFAVSTINQQMQNNIKYSFDYYIPVSITHAFMDREYWNINNTGRHINIILYSS